MGIFRYVTRIVMRLKSENEAHVFSLVRQEDGWLFANDHQHRLIKYEEGQQNSINFQAVQAAFTQDTDPGTFGITAARLEHR